MQGRHPAKCRDAVVIVTGQPPVRHGDGDLKVVDFVVKGTGITVKVSDGGVQQGADGHGVHLLSDILDLGQVLHIQTQVILKGSSIGQ